VRLNTDAHLRALKIGLLIMASLALITIIQAGQLPNHILGEIPDDQPSTRRERAGIEVRQREGHAIP